MAVNRKNTDIWKEDIIKSVDMYNDWFMNFAPKAFRATRVKTTKEVESALRATKNHQKIRPEILKSHTEILPTLRMSTCPPLAVDRLIGLAGVTSSLVKRMEKQKKLPVKMDKGQLQKELQKIANIIQKMADPDIFVWLGRKKPATKTEVLRAATIVADRLCGSVANPIIRNAQEKRQLEAIAAWLKKRGYRQLLPREGITFDCMPAGTYGFHMNVPVNLEGGEKQINIPVDIAIKTKTPRTKSLPIFFEAKSAGDFANVNKRRKEEAVKISQLKSTYGSKVSFNLFLCGYFDTGYLGYEAAEGIDWVWEHRIDDFFKFGI